MKITEYTATPFKSLSKVLVGSTEYAYIHHTVIEGQPDVVLRANRDGKGKLFCVQYGLSVTHGMGYIDATREYGECIFHALACAGRVNND